MKKIVHTILLAAAILYAHSNTFAQSQDADALRETGRSFMRQGDFPSALQALDKALEIKPGNLDILKDKAFIFYLQRDFTNTITIGRQLTVREDADAQSFQILGLAYKAIAEDKEADKMYKQALAKFPKNGALNSEYGELLTAAKKPTEAILYWERGIEGDPNYSGNYYFATKYYAQKGNIIWGLLYGEIFVNIESLSKRSDEIKTIIYGGYKKVFEDPSLLDDARLNGSSFDKAIAANLTKLPVVMRNGISPDALTALRTRFILNWFNGEGKQFPFRLFDNQRSMLQEGYFEAYNQWLIGPVADTQQFQQWTQNHADDVKGLQQYQRNALFKVPPGQYYPH